MTETHPAWISKGASLLFVIFCLELGLFLIIYPWTTRWTMNILPVWLPIPHDLWLSGYFRGAVSGIGIADLVIALSEMSRNRSRKRIEEKVAAD